MLRLINGPSLVGLAWCGCVCVCGYVARPRGERRSCGNREGEESQPRPISQTVNDRHMD